MKHGNPIFDKCTLLQACEWIAFKIPPMKQIYFNAHGFKRYSLLPEDFENPSMLSEVLMRFATQADKDYSKAIYGAAAKLKLAMYEGRLAVYGDVSIHENAQQMLGVAITGSAAPLGAKPFPEPKFVQITDIPDTMELGISKSMMKVRGVTYERVYIPYKDLKREFHSNYVDTTFNSIEHRYSTPYMDIMVEVISELKITATNQPSKKVLQDAVLHKMVERGLVGADGKPSTTLASYIATIIRMPESQRGHALTAPDSRSA